MRPSLPRISHKLQNTLLILINLLLATAIIVVSINIYHLITEPPAVTALRQLDIPDWITADLIKIDGASRRGSALDDLNAIGTHDIGNPGTSAQNNRNYFNNTDSTVSAHLVVGLEGEIIQCIPLHEKSSASNHRNSDTISIEVCHPDETGVFTDATYNARVRLTAWLCAECGLNEEQIIRHYDITGKNCPRWFVEDETAWTTFRTDVMTAKE